jgi:signal transduction histidine kinase
MNKLWIKLSLAFTAVVLVAVMVVVITGVIINSLYDDHTNFNDRVLKYRHGLIDQLENYYQGKQSWAGVDLMLVGAQALYLRTDEYFILGDKNKAVIYHIQPNIIGQDFDNLHPSLIYQTPLRVNDRIVGYLGVIPRPESFKGNNQPPPFIREILTMLLMIAAVLGTGGMLFGVIISRWLSRPLNDLAAAAKAIGARNLSRRVAQKGSDEIVAVARAFNEMAESLQQSELLRRNLLADVAHELRTPLSVLQGNLRAILDEVYPLNLEEMVRLYDQSRFLSRLVNDLHELAQAEAGQLPLDFQPVDLNKLVQSTVDAFRPGAESKGIILHTTLTGELPPASIDSARLRQVLQNLLSNALRHTPAGGAISVGTAATGDTLEFTVADTGDGIAPEHLAHVFDRFYRTDPARSRDKGGSGLGLAIARAIIENHHGLIRADSAGISGQGTTFTVQLPAAAN